ncbi:hypothetical protein D3C86_2060400 [compost metagenome]
MVRLSRRISVTDPRCLDRSITFSGAASNSWNPNSWSALMPAPANSSEANTNASSIITVPYVVKPCSAMPSW